MEFGSRFFPISSHGFGRFRFLIVFKMLRAARHVGRLAWPLMKLATCDRATFLQKLLDKIVEREAGLVLKADHDGEFPCDFPCSTDSRRTSANCDSSSFPRFESTDAT